MLREILQEMNESWEPESPVIGGLRRPVILRENISRSFRKPLIIHVKPLSLILTVTALSLQVTLLLRLKAGK